jgi:hypothetical protein
MESEEMERQREIERRWRVREGKDRGGQRGIVRGKGRGDERERRCLGNASWWRGSL